MFKGETRMAKSDKPQCNAARDFIMAMHANRRGEISTETMDMVGDRLNLLIEKHGKP